MTNLEENIFLQDQKEQLKDKVFLPEFDREYLNSKGYSFEEIVDGGNNGLIIRNFELPNNKYNHEIANLLIFIPQGYPETRPDMWYFSPEILLKPNNSSPKATESRQNFNGVTWQRWSRHYPAEEWRQGVDGIHTYLKKIKVALESAL